MNNNNNNNANPSAQAPLLAALVYLGRTIQSDPALLEESNAMIGGVAEILRVVRTHAVIPGNEVLAPLAQEALERLSGVFELN